MNAQNCIVQQAECSERKSSLQFLPYWRNLVAMFRRWYELAQQRRQLREMDDNLLKDIGLSRADVERIAGHRWFWDAPRNRREDQDQRYRSSDHGKW